MIRQAGHLDNSLVPVMIGILLIILFHDPLLNWLVPWWEQVSGRDILIVATTWICAVGLFGSAIQERYQRSGKSSAQRLVVESARSAVRIGRLIAGASMGLLTAYFVSAWLWLIAIPFLAACLAFVYRLRSPVMIATPMQDRVRIELPRSRKSIEAPKDCSPVVIDERHEGGAFGQPARISYRLSLGQSPIDEFSSRSEAESVGGMLADFLQVNLENRGENRP